MVARVSLVAVAAVLALSACSSDSGGSSGDLPAVASTNIEGWTPAAGSIPNFACNDDSYKKARTEGLTVGYNSNAPYAYMGDSGKPTGLDWDIAQAVFKYAGITKLDNQIMQFDSEIPGLLSDRIDVMTAVHMTPDRVKQIGFTTPAYWYGPAIILANGNPQKIATYTDLGRSDVNTGVVAGSAAQIYLQHVNAKTTVYKDSNTEMAALEAGRVSAVLDDLPIYLAYKQANPSTTLTTLSADAPSAFISDYGYGYVRWGLRKGDCSLNYALSTALTELSTHGVISRICNRYGLTLAMLEPGIVKGTVIGGG